MLEYPLILVNLIDWSFVNRSSDLMSYYELHQQSLSDVRLVSMEGLKGLLSLIKLYD